MSRKRKRDQNGRLKKKKKTPKTNRRTKTVRLKDCDCSDSDKRATVGGTLLTIMTRCRWLVAAMLFVLPILYWTYITDGDCFKYLAGFFLHAGIGLIVALAFLLSTKTVNIAFANSDEGRILYSTDRFHF